jgi:hypothetical protein
MVNPHVGRDMKSEEVVRREGLGGPRWAGFVIEEVVRRERLGGYPVSGNPVRLGG